MEPHNRRVPHDQWVQPISEFSATRQNLPHLQLPGSWYWTESNTWNGLVLDEAQRDLVFSTVHHHAGKKYDLEAVVVMPTHIHMIIHPLVKNEKGYYSLPEIFHSIKSYTAKQIVKQLRERERVVVADLGNHSNALCAGVGAHHAGWSAHHTGTGHASPIHVWQDENYDHIIRNEKDYYEKLYYLIMNPVEARLVERPEEYRWLYYKGMPAK